MGVTTSSAPFALSDDSVTLQKLSPTATAMLLASATSQTIDTVGANSTVKISPDDNLSVECDVPGSASAEECAMWQINAPIAPAESISIKFTVKAATITDDNNCFVWVGFSDQASGFDNDGKPASTNQCFARIRSQDDCLIWCYDGANSNTSGTLTAPIAAGQVIELKWTNTKVSIEVDGVEEVSHASNIPSVPLSAFVGVGDSNTGSALAANLKISDISINKLE